MQKTIRHGSRTGTLTVPASKSWAHRMLITAALSKDACEMYCDGISKDIAATTECLNGLGAEIRFPQTESKDDVIRINPINMAETGVDANGIECLGEYSVLKCGESGSTLRFLLPVVGALGAKAVFLMEGRLSERPMGPLVDELRRHGMDIRQDGKYLYCSGKLQAGDYNIPGNISSQYISGLLLALPILDGDSRIVISGTIESADYIEMTERAVKNAGIVFDKNDQIYNIEGKQNYSCPKVMVVEKDWSSASFPLCMGAFSEEGIAVTGLNIESGQGDKEILNVLKGFGAEVSLDPDAGKYVKGYCKKDCEPSVNKPGGSFVRSSITVRKGYLKGQIVDASGIPDLVPVICVLGAGAIGDTRIVHAERLRFKESDRIMTTLTMLKSLGADAEETEDGLIIHGTGRLKGGITESFKDHRIAMSAAVAAGICEGDVIVKDAECTDKSFPGFWDVLETLDIV